MAIARIPMAARTTTAAGDKSPHQQPVLKPPRRENGLSAYFLLTAGFVPDARLSADAEPLIYTYVVPQSEQSLCNSL